MKYLKNAKFIFILLLTIEVIYASVCCALFYEPINISISTYPPANRQVENLALFSVPIEVLQSKKYDNVNFLDVELVPENYSGNYIQYKASKLPINKKQTVNVGIYPVNLTGNAIPASIDAWQVVVREHLADGKGQVLKSYSFHYGVTWKNIQLAAEKKETNQHMPVTAPLMINTGSQKEMVFAP